MTPQSKVTPSPEVKQQHAFAAGTQGEEEAHQQHSRLATTFDDLLGDDDTIDESADDIIRAVRAWRDVCIQTSGSAEPLPSWLCQSALQCARLGRRTWT